MMSYTRKPYPAKRITWTVPLLQEACKGFTSRDDMRARGPHVLAALQRRGLLNEPWVPPRKGDPRNYGQLDRVGKPWPTPNDFTATALFWRVAPAPQPD